MQPIHLIDSRPHFAPRAALLACAMGLLTVAAAYVLGGVMNLEQQVLSLVMLDVLLLTTIVAFYDITNSIVLWLWALTCITRYTQLNLPGIPDMSGPRFMLVLMWGVFGVEWALRRRDPLQPKGIELCMLIYIGVCVASMIQHENFVHSVKGASPITAFMNFVIFPFSVYYMVRNSSASDRGTKKILWALSLLQIYLALTGIFEHYRIKWLVFPPDILDPKAGEGRWYGVRARGPYLHSPIYGAAMGMGFFLLLHYFNTVKSKFKWLMVIGLLATPLACFYTLTRQVWIGLALPMLFGAFFSKRQRMMLVVLALAAAALLVTVKPADIIDPEVAKKRAGDEATGQARIAHYVIGFHMFLDRPIFGFGLQMWDASWENYRMRTTNFKSMFGTIDMNLARKVHAHNTFLRIAVELGLVGLIPFLAIFVLIFRASLHLYRHSHPNGLYGRELTLAYWQMAIAFLVCVSFVDPSMDEFLHGYFLTVTALIIRRSELVEQPAAALAAGMTFGSRA